jgi:hypothetical protein
LHHQHHHPLHPLKKNQRLKKVNWWTDNLRLLITLALVLSVEKNWTLLPEYFSTARSRVSPREREEANSENGQRKPKLSAKNNAIRMPSA